MFNIARHIGAKVIGGINYLGDFSLLLIKTVKWLFKPPLKVRSIFEQVVRIGIDSAGISMLIAFFTGMIMSIQTAYQMQKVSAEMYIASLVSLSMVRELGPVLTALIVAGRAGAAITAEIGTMQVTEQIDALKSLAADPIKYLVVPRFLALLISMPILVMMGNIVGILGGYIICVYKLAIPGQLYMENALTALVAKDIFISLTKGCVFGILIALVSCLEGFMTKAGAVGVGKATTMSVVNSFIAILSADWFITSLFYFVF